MPQYRAIAPIRVGWVLAHAPGDLVPEANIAANGWEDLVEEIVPEPVAPPEAVFVAADDTSAPDSPPVRKSARS